MAFFTCQNIPNHLARYILGILRVGLTTYVFLAIISAQKSYKMLVK